MIQVKEVGPEARDQWNRYIEQNPSSIAWQMYDWSDVVARHYKYQFYPLAAWEDRPSPNGKDAGGDIPGLSQEIVGILPLYLGSVGKTKGLISVPFAVAGGILGNHDAARKALLEKAISISDEHGGIPITLKQYKIRISGDLNTNENYFNRELSLQCRDKFLQAQIDPGNLALAEEAIKEGLEVEYPATDISAFYDILLRHHSAEGVPCVSQAWIRTLIDFDLYSFALARVEGRLVAATMVKKFKNTVSFPFSCIRPHGKEGEIAAYGLYWNLITRFAAEGFEIFHSGRIPKTLKVANFRLGWGGTAYPYYYQTYPNRQGLMELKSRGGLKRRLVSTVWKGLPLSVARRLGPVIVGQFP